MDEHNSENNPIEIEAVQTQSEQPVQNPSQLYADGTGQKVTCLNCGAEFNANSMYCSVCGAKQGTKKKSIKPLIIIGAAVVVAVLILLFILLLARGSAVKEVGLNKTDITIDIGDEATLICTITPSDAKNKSLSWSTSNASIATVDSSGKITGIEPGSCTITVSSKNGKTATCKVVVNEHIDNFMELFSEWKANDWCEIASDGSWLTLDSNPKDDDSDSTAFLLWYIVNGETVGVAVKDANAALGFNDALQQKMNTTTALQGRQSEENEKYKVSWTYHPDKGLEIMYEVKGK